eukprot:NODE_47_length_2761_cov_148.716445_g41_i0.p1 GENE.NODE_47_length_2761_cov_148.716445_g41_i0~~NODE_47_length_2761_cov_148.716445_g41_i0.p1  ORF type:complete len:845 (+),score=215.67 NODE_47_length_2761_cov_148.716445_g41_i0:361-2535(+)
MPEGLPLAVSISLAYSMKSMMKDNCLVRIFSACETMGGATAICSDKTGTLTTNNMTVVQGWVAERNFVIPEMGVRSLTVQDPDSPSEEKDGLDHVPQWALEKLCEGLSVNSTAVKELDSSSGALKWAGDKTEIGLLEFAEDKLKQDPLHIRNMYDTRKVYPFNSEKKRMSTLIRKGGGEEVLHTKGAPELILAQCTQYVSSNGDCLPLSEVKRAYLMSVLTIMALQGNRVILVAFADLSLDEFPEDEPVDEPLTVLAILGIQNPIRAEVPAAVRGCQLAGISVRMVTGDNLHTAVTIATRCGIYQEGHSIAMEGAAFRDMFRNDKAGLIEIFPKLQVLARSSPEDKRLLVHLIQRYGGVVSVTGDGTSDGPALKLADVGFSMRTGTEIAQCSSDIVLLDDNFASILKAVKWGRNINDNVRKFIQFQVTSNAVVVLLTFIGAVGDSSNQSPLSAVQLLWLNMIMDTLAALALATEQPTDELLDRNPIPKGTGLISVRMLINIIGQIIYQLVTLLLLLHKGHVWLELEYRSVEHTTVVFNTLVLMQIWNEFNARKLSDEWNVFSGITRSKCHIAVFILMMWFQFVVVESLGNYMGTAPLSLDEWRVCNALGMMCLPVGFLLRLIPIKKDNSVSPGLSTFLFIPGADAAPLHPRDRLIRGLQKVRTTARIEMRMRNMAGLPSPEPEPTEPTEPTEPAASIASRIRGSVHSADTALRFRSASTHGTKL